MCETSPIRESPDKRIVKECRFRISGNELRRGPSVMPTMIGVERVVLMSSLVRLQPQQRSHAQRLVHDVMSRTVGVIQ